MLSRKQAAVLGFGKRSGTLHVAEGGVRSGKTFCTGLGWAIWAMQTMRGEDHLIAGRTVESVMRNVVECPGGLLEVFTELGYEPRILVKNGQRLEVPTDSGTLRAYITGASDRRSHMRIQGATLGGLLLDEGPLVPEPFWRMVWSRLSVEGAKAWVTLNPESPSHWWYREVNERIDDYYGSITHFSLDDNPSLSGSVKTRLARAYTGHWHRRLIEGQWAAPAGLIFPNWTKGDIPPKTARFAFGLDWAISGVFAMLAFRVKGRQAWLDDELTWDANEVGPRDEDQAVHEISKWTAASKVPSHSFVYADPNSPDTFLRKLRGEGFTVRKADNAVAPGLLTTANRLANQGITIHPRCKRTLREIEGYIWDPVAAEQGEDRPLKGNDHCMDALRYFAHTTGKGIGTGPVPISEALNAH